MLESSNPDGAEEFPSNESGSGESMASLLAEQESRAAGKIISGVIWVPVISVLADQVLVDVGEKREAFVPLTEFASRAPKVGERIPVVLARSGGGLRPSQMSYSRAKDEISWQAIAKAYAQKSRVRGRVVSIIKGGYLVDLGGVNAFMPASLADLRPIRKPESLLQSGVRCYVIEIHETRRQAVVSRKAVLEEEEALRRAKAVSRLRVGQVCLARVLYCDSSGILMDLGGLEGFVAVADVAWGAPQPFSGFERGRKLKVKVLGLPRGAEKVSLGIKQLLANPAEALKKKHSPKSVVTAEIQEVRPDGLLLKLKDSSPAFCRSAECPAQRAWKAGERVEAVVLGVDEANLWFSLSIARYEDMEEKKRMKGYLNPPKPLTLGQILLPDDQ